MTNITLDVAQALEDAYSAYKSGNLAEAQQRCQQIIAMKHEFFDVFNLLACVQSRLGKAEAAIANYDRAIVLRPFHAKVHNDRGNVLYKLKRFDEALTSYDRALGLWPDYAEVLNNRGVALEQLNRFDEALTSYDRALAVQPNSIQVLNNRGNVLQKMKRFEEAVASYDQALTMQQEYAEALNNRGNALHKLQRYDAALASYDHALILRPDYAEALINRGLTLHELKRFEEAVATYNNVLAVNPDHSSALFNRGNTLKELKRFAEALASYDRAIATRPAYPEAFNNRGVVLNELKRYDEALASYSGALAVSPEHVEAHHNRALCRLLLGDFDHGFEEYEWRLLTDVNVNRRRNFAQPRWTGTKDIAGHKILLHAEQGFGDTIQFCRYVPFVIERGAQVILEVQKPLVELMGSIAGVAQIVAQGESLPTFDVHCPLSSLPLAFGTRLETIPSGTPYLHASRHVALDWANKLDPKHNTRIGVAWSGRPVPDPNRSISLRSLLALFEIDATFVSLQKDVPSADLATLKNCSKLFEFSISLKDFSHTAALISNLDLVISIDTSVAHLAGALGKPVWVMLPFVSDWRWLLDRNDSPWYPTARLFRQNETRSWDHGIARVRAALSDFVHTHKHLAR